MVIPGRAFARFDTDAARLGLAAGLVQGAGGTVLPRSPLG